MHPGTGRVGNGTGSAAGKGVAGSGTVAGPGACGVGNITGLSTGTESLCGGCYNRVDCGTRNAALLMLWELV